MRCNLRLSEEKRDRRRGVEKSSVVFVPVGFVPRPPILQGFGPDRQLLTGLPFLFKISGGVILAANLLTTLTHPAGQTAGSTPQAGAQSGPAPATVTGQFTKTVYTVSANAISNVDTRDLVPLLASGWV